MKASIRIFQPVLLCVGLALPLVAQEGTKVIREIPASTMTRMSGTVEALDLQKRELSIRTGLGILIVVPVDKRVTRLNEIAVGDKINVDYYVSVATEIREPTAQEKQEPISVATDTRKSAPGTAPTGAAMRILKAVTTVEGIDRPTQMLSLKGPRGNVYGVRASDEAKLGELNLGDKVVVYFTEAVAVSLEKQTPSQQKAAEQSPP